MATRAEQLAALQADLEKLKDQRRDLKSLQLGIDFGLMTEDEFTFAMALEDQPPGSLFKPNPGQGVGPLKLTAQHIRQRARLKVEADAHPDSRIAKFGQFLAGTADSLIRNSVQTASGLVSLAGEAGAIGAGALLTPFTGRSVGQQRLDVRESVSGLTNDFLEATGLAADEPLSEARAAELAITRPTDFGPGQLQPGVMGELTGQLISLVAMTVLGNAAGLGRLGTGSGVLSRALGPKAATASSATSALALQGALGLTGAYLGYASAPEDAGGVETTIRAVSGAGYMFLGGSAVMGRPYGPLARQLAVKEAQLAAVSARTARVMRAAAGGGTQTTIKGLERFGIVQSLKRGTYRITTKLAFSPRTTVGQLVGAGAIGASFITGQEIAAGKTPEEAIMNGVIEGGAWMGADFAFARILGGAQAASMQGLWTQNIENWLLAAGAPIGAARAAGAAGPPLQRAAIGAAVGAGIDAAADDEPGVGIGLAVGAAGGMALIGKVRSHLASYLPRDVYLKIVDGQFGKLTSTEAGMVAESLLSGATRQTMYETKDPLVRALMVHLMGPRGETRRVLGLLPAPRASANRSVVSADLGPTREFKLPAQTRTAREAVETEASIANTRASRKALPAPVTSATGALKQAPPPINVLRERLAVVQANLKEAGQAKRRGATTVAARSSGQLRGEAAGLRRQIAEIEGAQGGIFDLPALTGDAMAMQLGRLKQRQMTMTRELMALEVAGATPFDPRVLRIARDYAGLRDQYARVLELGGVHREVAARTSREQVLRTGTPGRPEIIQALPGADTATVGARAAGAVPEVNAADLTSARRVVEMADEVAEPTILALADELSTVESARRITNLLRTEAPRVSPTVGRPIARRGAALPDTITQQGISDVGTTLDEVRQFAMSHGLDVKAIPSPTRVQLVTTGGKVLAEAANPRGLLAKLGGMAGRKAEAGFASQEGVLGAGGGVLGATAGAYVGAKIEAMLRDYPSGVGTGVGIAAGFLGGAALALTLGRRAGLSISASGRNIIQIAKVKIVEPLTREQVARVLGRNNVTTETFEKMPAALQTEHVRLGAVRIGNTKNITDAAKQDELATFLRKYTPDALPAELEAETLVAVQGAANAANMPEDEFLQLWRGFLTNMTYPRVQRPRGSGTASLFHLARDPKSPFASAEGLAELRDMSRAIEYITGGGGGVGHSAAERAATRVAIRESGVVSPHAEELRAYTTAMDKQDLRRLGVNTATVPRTLSSIRPMESLRRDAFGLIQRGDPDGHITMNYFNKISHADTQIRVAFDRDSKQLAAVYGDLTPDERQIVRFIQEGGFDSSGVKRTAAEWRKKYAGHNDRLIRAADVSAEMKRAWAERLGMPTDMMVEDYYPWYYSQATMRELRSLTPARRRQVPMTGAYGIGVQESKLFRSAMRRSRDEPIAGTIDDAMEADLIYLFGAARKFYLDQMLAQISKGTLKDLSTRQPHIAGDIGRWISDLHGIPSASHMKLQATFNNIGINMQSWPMFNNFDFMRTLAVKVENADPARLARMVRAWEFGSKIYFNYISPLVNMSQLFINTGAETGLAQIAAGSMNLIGAKSQALAPWLDPQAVGAATLKAITEDGILSSRIIKTFDGLSAGLGKQGVSKVAGGAVGGVAGLVTTPEDSSAARSIAQVGAGIIAGVTGARLSPRFVRNGLLQVERVAVGLFDGVEVINRAVTATATRRATARALDLKAAGKTGRAFDVAEQAVTGAGVGALAGATQAEEDTLLGRLGSEEAILGAAMGTAAGIGIGAAGETTSARLLRELEQSGGASRRMLFADLEGQIAKQVPTREETLRWMTRQITEQTQFKMTRGARGSALRTPVGEAMASLQTYTLNQLEFTGMRMESFFRSWMRNLDTGLPLKTGETAFGNLDMRIFKHIMLIMGTGSLYTAMSAGLDSNRGLSYWTGRIGMGLFPFVRYNEAANAWTVESLQEAIKGPLISDVDSIIRKGIFPLFTQAGNKAFYEQADDIANDLVSLTRQAGDTVEMSARMLELLNNRQADGIADLIRERGEVAAARIQRPVSATVTGEPVPRQTGSGGGGDLFGGGGGDLFGGQ